MLCFERIPDRAGRVSNSGQAHKIQRRVSNPNGRRWIGQVR